MAASIGNELLKLPDVFASGSQDQLKGLKDIGSGAAGSLSDLGISIGGGLTDAGNAIANGLSGMSPLHAIQSRMVQRSLGI